MNCPVGPGEADLSQNQSRSGWRVIAQTLHTHTHTTLPTTHTHTCPFPPSPSHTFPSLLFFLSSFSHDYMPPPQYPHTPHLPLPPHTPTTPHALPPCCGTAWVLQAATPPLTWTGSALPVYPALPLPAFTHTHNKPVNLFSSLWTRGRRAWAAAGGDSWRRGEEAS